MTQWAMVIDLDKCTGCQSCSTACAMENDTLPGESWQDVLFYTEGRYPNATIKWFPRPCMHCENPTCAYVCPTRATYQTEDGVVLIDYNRCIGCKHCMIACPYGVRFYASEDQPLEPDLREVFPSGKDQLWSPPYQSPDQDWSEGRGIPPKSVVSKCTFCYHRIQHAPEGVSDLDEHDPELVEYVPACVRSCPPKARYFGDLDDPESRVNRLIAEKRGVRLKEETGNRPKVYYLGEHGTIPDFDPQFQQSPES